MNLTLVTQAFTGGVQIVSDPLRDREFKRARRQVSDGIQGLAVGAAIIVVAVLCYVFIPQGTWVYILSLALALAGIVKLFRSIGGIVDARVGPKLLDPALQPRATGGLTPSNTGPVGVRSSGRLADPLSKPPAPTRPVNTSSPAEKSLAEKAPSTQERPAAPVQEPPARYGTGRINREHSSPLRKPENDEDLMSLLRN
jgi:hypothetical protein